MTWKHLITHAVRVTLTVGLLWGAWTETGPWTVACLALVGLQIELGAVLRRLRCDLRHGEDDIRARLRELHRTPQPKPRS